MNDTPDTPPLKKIAAASMEILRDLSKQGTDLSTETLFNAMRSHKDLKSFAAEPASAKMPGVAEIDTLKSQLETQRAQKSDLLKQIDTLEDQQGKVETFYRNSLLFFIRQMGGTVDAVSQPHIDTLRATLQGKNASHAEVAEAFQALREAVLKEAMDQAPDAAAPKTKSASLLGRFFKSSDTAAPPDSDADAHRAAAFNHLKGAYQHFLDTLKMHLGKPYHESILQIEKEIAICSQIEDLQAIRKLILQQIETYIGHVDGERALTLEFINEIGRRLVDVENRILAAMDQNSRIDSINQDFSQTLEAHLDALRADVDYSRTLEELQKAVVSKLDTINQAVSERQLQRDQLKSDADAHTKKLRDNLDLMKNQIENAEKRARALEQELLKDPLTDAYNRRAYDRKIEEELERFRRYGTIFSLLLFDVDHFKKINDTYGHTTGDKCLREIIARIKPNLRKCDFLARYGGEEFVALLPETKSGNARIAAEKLRKIIENIEFIHKGDTVRITISIGVTEVVGGDNTPETLFNRLDKAMYKAKNAGRNTVVVR